MSRAQLPCYTWYMLFFTQGGLKAVVWTDVFQVGIMVAGFSSVIIRAVVVQEGIGRIVNDSYYGGRLNFWEWVVTWRWCAFFLISVKLNCYWRWGVGTKILQIFKQADLVWRIFCRINSATSCQEKNLSHSEIHVVRMHFGFHGKWMVNSRGQSYL